MKNTSWLERNIIYFWATPSGSHTVLDCVSTKYHNSWSLQDMDFGVLQKDAILLLSHSFDSSQSDPTGGLGPAAGHSWQHCWDFPSLFLAFKAQSPLSYTSSQTSCSLFSPEGLGLFSTTLPRQMRRASSTASPPWGDAHGWMNIEDTGTLLVPEILSLFATLVVYNCNTVIALTHHLSPVPIGSWKCYLLLNLEL